METASPRGFFTRTRPTPSLSGGTLPGWIDRDAAADLVVLMLGARRSAWNTADIRGKTEVLLAQTALVANPAARIELAEDVTCPGRRAAPAADPTRRPRTRPIPHLAWGPRASKVTSSPGSPGAPITPICNVPTRPRPASGRAVPRLTRFGALDEHRAPLVVVG